MHTFEQSYKDILNSLENLNENGTIVIHDCNPTSEHTQRPVPVSDVWHGDVWKSILKLRLENPNVDVCTVDADEGCGIVKKGTQTLLNPKDTSVDMYQYDVLNANRHKILNLITVDQFKEKYL